MKILLFSVAVIALLAGCSSSTKASSKTGERWYTKVAESVQIRGAGDMFIMAASVQIRGADDMLG